MVKKRVMQARLADKRRAWLAVEDAQEGVRAAQSRLEGAAASVRAALEDISRAEAPLRSASRRIGAELQGHLASLFGSCDDDV